MALNDFIVKYECIKCGAEMNEIPGINDWGEHVYSWYKCSDPNCDNECEDCEDIEEKMIITYINVRR